MPEGIDRYTDYADFNWSAQFWFNLIVPTYSRLFYQELLSTWTTEPWGHSIAVEYYEDDTSQDQVPIYWGLHYSFIHESLGYNVSSTYWITAGESYSEYYPGVIRKGGIQTFDVNNGSLIDEFWIQCSPSGPRVNSMMFSRSVNDLTESNAGYYIIGETDNSIVWNDFFLPDAVPIHYSLYLNGIRRHWWREIEEPILHRLC